ncbi:MAG: hypothetical protein ACLFRZ_01500 [Rhodosalinus sp.]
MSVILNGIFDCSQDTLEMLQRQARVWTEGHFGPEAQRDWDPLGELTAPGNVVPFARLARVVEDFHRDYTGLRVVITSAFESPSGWIGLEWTWDVARRSDGARSVTPDAIIVERRKGLILSWREYFDTAGAVEAHHG